MKHKGCAYHINTNTDVCLLKYAENNDKNAFIIVHFMCFVDNSSWGNAELKPDLNINEWDAKLTFFFGMKPRIAKKVINRTSLDNLNMI